MFSAALLGYTPTLATVKALEWWVSAFCWKDLSLKEALAVPSCMYMQLGKEGMYFGGCAECKMSCKLK